MEETMHNPSFQGDVCSYKQAFTLDNFIRRLFQRPEKIVGPYISPGNTVIDLGCGPGFFTIDMARLTGDNGKVIAVDIQNEMLARVASKAALGYVKDIIVFHQSTQDAIGLDPDTAADFILAYYMVHEALDKKAFLTQIRDLLSAGGQVLIVEPPFHVSKAQFRQMEEIAVDTGFKIKDRPRKKGGKSLLLAPA